MHNGHGWDRNKMIPKVFDKKVPYDPKSNKVFPQNRFEFYHSNAILVEKKIIVMHTKTYYVFK